MLIRNTPLCIYLWMLELSGHRGTIKDRAATPAGDAPRAEKEADTEKRDRIYLLLDDEL